MSGDADFLDQFSPVPPSSRLRLSILEATTQIVRRRRRQRRVLQAGLLAATVLLAAGLIRWWTWPDQAPDGRTEWVEQKVERIQPAEKPLSPLAQEWQAFDAGQDRAAQYLQAGQRYLQENHDPESAWRCYREALDAPNSPTEISANDDWLLLALKLARQKEKNDANPMP